MRLALQSALPALPMLQASGDAGTDARLLDRIAGGDAGAVGELYDRHQRLLYGLIQRILRDRAEAEEVLQEVFLAVWTRAATYDAALGVPAAWLVRIARNRAIDRLRKREVRENVSGDAAAIDEHPEMPDTQLERQHLVRRALDALPRAQRTLIEHAFFLGLTHPELAAHFQLPIGTVKTRIRAGLSALRQQVEKVVT